MDGKEIIPEMKIKAVCFDMGDTLVAEETVVHDSLGRSLTADVIDGAFEVLEKLKKDGYELALIVNGDSVGTRNIIEDLGLQDRFEVIVISGEEGIEKPDSRIFMLALDKLGVRPEDTVMVGNRIDTDIVGANRLGITSVYFKWNNRYNDSISSQEVKPAFVVDSLLKLPDILSRLG